MFDLLTPQESAHAAANGWGVHQVYDLDRKRWALEILPTDHPKTSAVQAQMSVYTAARLGDAVAMRGLQLVVRSHQPTKPAKKGKKK